MKKVILFNIFALSALFSAVSCVSGAGQPGSFGLQSSAGGGGPLDDEGEIDTPTASAPDRLFTPLDFKSSASCIARPKSRFVSGCDVTSVAGLFYIPFKDASAVTSLAEIAKEELGSLQDVLRNVKILAYDALIQGNPDQAISYINILEKKGSVAKVDAEAMTIKGNAFVLLDKKDEALRSYSAAMNLESRNSLANLNFGLWFYRKGETLQAVLHFKRAIAGNAVYLASYLHAADAAYLLGNMEDAMTLLEKSEENFAGEPLVFYNMAVVNHFGLSKEFAAKQLYLKVLNSRSAPAALRATAKGFYSVVVGNRM